MESKQTSPFVERPIILSPPPLNNPNIINNYHNRRNQSVGYNLQHEFETLSADLDLDLKDDIKVNQASVTVPNSSLPTNPLSSINANLNSVSAPATASVPNLTNQPQSQFINTISPTPTNVNVSQAGLDSLLNQNFLPSLNLPIRPQSVNDFNLFPSNNGNTNNGGNINGSNVNPTNPMTNQDQSNFYMELMRFTNWIENLNGQEHSLMIDYLCGNLSIDILMNFKTKLDQNLSGSQLPNFYQQQSQHLLQQQQTQHSNLRQQSHHNQGFSGIGSPYEYTQSDVIDNFDNLNLNDNVLHQPKPRDKNILNGNNYQNTVLSNFNNNLPGSRPRSAEPTMIQNHKNTHYLDRAKSPTNHLYEKTNFLQLAAARSPGLNPHDESLDMSQKLGALATINSRVALDSNKKHHLHGNHYYDPTGRSVNSSSVPLSNSGNIIGNNTSNNNKSGIKSPNFKQQAQNITNRKNTSSPLTVRSNGNNTNGNSSGTENSQSNSSMPADVTNLELLNNIPAWLKLLRLHKYTECLKEVHWKQLIELDDQALEDKGVKALGARRKLLKAFDVIKTSSV